MMTLQWIGRLRRGFGGIRFAWDSKGLDFIEREPLFCLGNRLFPIEWAEFPIDDDDASLRQVFEVSDDAVAELTRRGFLDLECFHSI